MTLHYEESLMTYSPACGMCAHLREVGDHEEGAGWTCDAFPDGIPADLVLMINVNHEEPYPGDNGVRYQGRVIIPKRKKIGYYYDWEGKAHDAETHKIIEFEKEVR